MRAGAAPRVSVGLPVYNGERYLREAVESILGQTWADLELVVSDNASTDGTEAICREYAARDSRVRYHRAERNMGAVWNFNRAFELARGELFMWAAFDDRRHPEHLSRCVAALDASPAAVLCCTGVQLIDEEGQPFSDPEWPRGIRPVGSTPEERAAAIARATFWYDFYGLMRAGVLRGVLPARAGWGFDVVVTLDMCLRGEVVALPEPLFEYRAFRAKAPADLAQTLAPAAVQGGIRVSWAQLALSLVESCLRAPLPAPERLRVARRVYEEFCLRNHTVRWHLEREEVAGAVRHAAGESLSRGAGTAALALSLRADQALRWLCAGVRARWGRLRA